MSRYRENEGLMSEHKLRCGCELYYHNKCEVWSSLVAGFVLGREEGFTAGIDCWSRAMKNAARAPVGSDLEVGRSQAPVNALPADET